MVFKGKYIIIEESDSRFCLNCNKKLNSDYLNRRFCSQECQETHYYQKNKERIKRKSKENYEKNIGKTKKEKSLKYKKWYEKNKGWVKKYMKDYYQKHKYKSRCRRYALENFKKILLKKSKNKCSRCPSDLNLEIHHIQYTQKEEDCIILCKKCHQKIHRKYSRENVSTK